MRMDAESETLIPSGGGFDVAHSLKAEGFDASEDGTGRGVPIIPIQEIGKRTHSGGSGQNGCGIGNAGDPMFTLQAQAQHAISVGLGSDPLHADELAQPITNRNGDPGVIAFSSKDHGADAGEVAPTLRSMGHDKSHPNAGGQVAIQQGIGVRRLTPRECERLQGFPDDYTLVRYRNKPAADGPRYKAIGNSMARPVMEWIGRRIDLVTSAGRE